MKEKYEDTNEERFDPRPIKLFCEQHGWTGVNEGICYGSTSCKDAAICVMAANFAARHREKN